MLTELVFIMDRSGSMSGLESDTIRGFNALLEKQRKENGSAYVSTVLFDSYCEVLHDRIPIDKIAYITEREYYVRGCTALYDAIGGAIHHISNVHKYARPEDLPEKTVFVITTDGLENASCVYSQKQVKEMIEYEKENFHWEFLFFGANIDAVSTAADIGIGKERAVRFINDAEGITRNFKAVSEVISDVRCCRKVAEDWKISIEEDYRQRGK